MLKDFLTLLYPEVCVSCEKVLKIQEQSFCIKCQNGFPNFYDEEYLNNKFRGKAQVDSCIGLYKLIKEGALHEVLHKIKYAGEEKAAIRLGELFGQNMVSKGQMCDLIIPLPLHRKRKKQRGYNQSALIAEGISNVTGISWSDDLVIRSRFTESQTKKGKIERWKNVSDIFHVVDVDKVKGKKILIIDDIITTGATLEACCMSVLKYSPSSISIGGIAITT